MIIAKQKKRENIAEYVLYMWQLEDIIRSCKLDANNVRKLLIDTSTLNDETKTEAAEWYENLVQMMQNEQLADKGHLQIVKNIVADINDLHLKLLQTPKEIQYNALFFKTLPFLVEFRNKQQAGAETDDIELCFNALYASLLLKLNKKEISKETQTAIDHISKLIATLAAKYKADSNGEIDWE